MKYCELKAFFRHGFAIQEEKTTPDEHCFIDQVAEKAKRYHLTFPLLAFVEGLRPASYLASSLLTGLEPFAELFFPTDTYKKLVTFVGKRKSLEQLVEKLGE